MMVPPCFPGIDVSYIFGGAIMYIQKRNSSRHENRDARVNLN